jgi:hypothetical protein
LVVVVVVVVVVGESVKERRQGGERGASYPTETPLYILVRQADPGFGVAVCLSDECFDEIVLLLRLNRDQVAVWLRLG